MIAPGKWTYDEKTGMPVPIDKKAEEWLNERKKYKGNWYEDKDGRPIFFEL